MSFIGNIVKSVVGDVTKAAGGVLNGVGNALHGAATFGKGLLSGNPKEWSKEQVLSFRKPAARLHELCVQMTELRHRPLFYALSRRVAFLRTGPLWIVGPLYGIVVFCAMNYGTLPLLSWLRSFYLGTPPRWPGSMSWPQLYIHMGCVGLPIAWGVRRARA